MKKLFGIIAVAFSVFLISCNKDEINVDTPSIEGTYYGTLVYNSGLKSATGGNHDGTAEVNDLGKGQIQVHCYGGDLDTTFMLNYFEDNNRVMVCMTGDAFQNMYGHAMSQNNLHNSGTMGHDNGNQTAWDRHMQDDHKSGDTHYGAFDMDTHSFNYTIKTQNGDYKFNGKLR